MWATRGGRMGGIDDDWERDVGFVRLQGFINTARWAALASGLSQTPVTNETGGTARWVFDYRRLFMLSFCPLWLWTSDLAIVDIMCISCASWVPPVPEESVRFIWKQCIVEISQTCFIKEWTRNSVQYLLSYKNLYDIIILEIPQILCSHYTCLTLNSTHKRFSLSGQLSGLLTGVIVALDLSKSLLPKNPPFGWKPVHSLPIPFSILKARVFQGYDHEQR